MRTLLVVGIGPGNPEQVTIEAINALNRADALFIPEKGVDKADLADLRREIVARYVTNPAARLVPFTMPIRDEATASYAARVADWHEAIAAIYARLIAEELGEDGTGAFLVWGDPSLYDSTLRILARVRGTGAPPFSVRVIPGITSLQALTAAHAIPLNRVGEPVLVTTGRRLAEAPVGTDTVVMLDGKLAFKALEGDDYDIHWGAYLGTPDEILVSGRLSEVAERIERLRAEARARHGWIMDTYLLRRRA
jgi:precorrin-6A synthase (deacetylating)